MHFSAYIWVGTYHSYSIFGSKKSLHRTERVSRWCPPPSGPRDFLHWSRTAFLLTGQRSAAVSSFSPSARVTQFDRTSQLAAFPVKAWGRPPCTLCTSCHCKQRHLHPLIVSHIFKVLPKLCDPNQPQLLFNYTSAVWWTFWEKNTFWKYNFLPCNLLGRTLIRRLTQ